jgi:hypothetical protein
MHAFLEYQRCGFGYSFPRKASYTTEALVIASMPLRHLMIYQHEVECGCTCRLEIVHLKIRTFV